MIPSSHAIVTLKHARQAALQAIIVESGPQSTQQAANNVCPPYRDDLRVGRTQWLAGDRKRATG